MKSCVVILALVSVALCAPEKNILAELHDFVHLIPLDRIREITRNHINDDKEFQAALTYVKGEEWKNIIKHVNARPSVKEIQMIVNEAGLNLKAVDKFMQAMINAYDVPESDEEARKSFGKFLEEVDHAIPYDELIALYEDKIENSPVFRRFIDMVTNEKVHHLVDKTLKSKEFALMAAELMIMDVQVFEVVDAIYTIAGWKSTEHTMNDLPK